VLGEPRHALAGRAEPDAQEISGTSSNIKYKRVKKNRKNEGEYRESRRPIEPSVLILEKRMQQRGMRWQCPENFQGLRMFF
jgi:hypothetical protein